MFSYVSLSQWEHFTEVEIRTAIAVRDWFNDIYLLLILSPAWNEQPQPIDITYMTNAKCSQTGTNHLIYEEWIIRILILRMAMFLCLRPLWALVSWDSASSNRDRICPIPMCVLCWYDKRRLMQWKSLLRHITPEQHSVCMHWLEVGIHKADLPQEYIRIYFIALCRYCCYQCAYQQYAL